VGRSRRRESLTESTPAANLRIRSLLTRPPVSCSADETIATASRTMMRHGVGSIVVLDPAGRPVGIVTDRDLRERVLAAGRSPADPVAAVMSAPLVTVSPEAFVFEALLEMARRGLHHLLVVEGGDLIGVISGHDLLLLQAAAPLALARAIQSCPSVAALAPVMPQLTLATRRLFEQGWSGYQIGRIVSEMNDLVVRRVLTLAQRELGGPPAAFCWLALGSEGRREQTIRTDQDNALVYEDPASPVEAAVARYFGALAAKVVDGLIRLGYPRCPGESMASNPRWCQPLGVWRRYFQDWVRDPAPDHLLYSAIYFDLRPVAGEFRLAGALQQEIAAQVSAWRSFPRHLATLAVSHRPPLSLFGRFVLDRGGIRGGLDLKLGGALLLTNALRAYAIDLGLLETNTIERLEAATRAGGCFTPGEAEDVRLAHETIARLRLRHQLERLAAGREPDNVVDPRTLWRADQRALKDAFRAIRWLQGKVQDRYLTEALG
jgi:CBS domain-containing protein